LSQGKTFFNARNEGRSGIVVRTAAYMPPIITGYQSSKRILSMTITTRIALGISAAALTLSLALAPAAFAQDAMKKDDGMKKDSMSKDDGMKKDSMPKDAMKKDDGGMMKKDDGMKKDNMSK
jgi:pentapeptide MXKDX repeat protein